MRCHTPGCWSGEHADPKGYVVQLQEHPGGRWHTVTGPTTSKEPARAAQALFHGTTRLFNIYTRRETA